jgi:CRP-like cAMP-binding protein
MCSIMPVPLARLDLRTALVQHSETIFRKRLSVLFRRGDPALGLFVVRSGSVNLDFGADSPLTQAYGQGALLGLPSALTRRPYCMTATVAQDSELAFCSTHSFNALMRGNPGLYQELLFVLGEKVAENYRVQKTLLHHSGSAALRSNIA